MAFLERLQFAAVEEFKRRIEGSDLWEGLTFSTSRVWQEILRRPYQDHIRLISATLHRRSHSMLFQNPNLLSSFDRELVALLDRIYGLYGSAFKYQTIGIKKQASRLALRTNSSLETGIRYPGSEVSPSEIERLVQNQNLKIQNLDQKLVSALRSCEEVKTALPDQILQPVTAKDLFGDEEDWKKFAEFDRLSGAEIRRTLVATIGSHYENSVSAGGFSFCKPGKFGTILLFIETSSMMGQFCYSYRFPSIGGVGSMNISLESLLGLGGGNWDMISKNDRKIFADDFFRVDQIMQNAWE